MTRRTSINSFTDAFRDVFHGYRKLEIGGEASSELLSIDCSDPGMREARRNGVINRKDATAFSLSHAALAALANLPRQFLVHTVRPMSYLSMKENMSIDRQSQASLP